MGGHSVAGITVDAVREQLAQLGHTDVSDEVITDFLTQLAADGGLSGETNPPTDEALDDEAPTTDAPPPCGFAATTTPRATLAVPSTAARRAPVKRGKVPAGRGIIEHDQPGPPPSAGRASGSEVNGRATGAQLARSPAGSPSSASTPSPAHKRAAHATPGGAHATHRRSPAPPHAAPHAGGGASVGGTPRRPASAGAARRSHHHHSHDTVFKPPGRTAFTAMASPPPRLDFSTPAAPRRAPSSSSTPRRGAACAADRASVATASTPVRALAATPRGASAGVIRAPLTLRANTPGQHHVIDRVARAQQYQSAWRRDGFLAGESAANGKPRRRENFAAAFAAAQEHARKGVEAAKRRGAVVLAEKKQVKLTDAHAGRQHRRGEKGGTVAGITAREDDEKGAIGWGPGGQENAQPKVDRPRTAPRPSYVAPNEKRRDGLRWEMRQRMANPPTF